MTRYLVQPRDWIFVKDLSFAKNRSKNIAKKISKILDGKYNQKLFDHVKQSATDAVKTFSKRVIQTAGANSDLFGNKIDNKIIKDSKHLQQNNLETIGNENDKETSKKRYMSPEKKIRSYWWFKINKKIINLSENTPN